MMIRRVDGSTIHVTFAKPIRADGPVGTRLAALAAEGAHLETDAEGAYIAVECDQKALLRALAEAGVSKETLAGMRRALDESKSARRERMRR